MLRVMHIEELEGLLLQVPNLVQQQEARAFDFPAKAAAWLNLLEKAFIANRLSQAGDIATLRSGLVAAQQGQLPAGIQFRGRPTRLRMMVALASDALKRATEVASALIASHRPRLSEGERVAQQIVAVAISRRLIPGRRIAGNNTDYLRMLRLSFLSIADLELAFVHLEGLVGPHDALVLFDRALEPYVHLSTPEPKEVEVQMVK
jgi:hypothetical protein